MKGFALLIGALVGAGLLYVTTATGGQQAGPTRAEFNALKKTVNTLKKDDQAVQAVLAGCLSNAIPSARFDGYEYRASDGSTVITTAIDVAEQGDSPTIYLLDVGQACAGAINSAARLHGLDMKVRRPGTTLR
ncbi:MAG: hypothetical protein ACJ74C_12735 [Gaiellaceae bacterium]